MPHKRFLALLAAAALAGCASPPAQKHEQREPRPTPSAQLSTSDQFTFNGADPCASVPSEVVTPAGFDATPVHGSEEHLAMATGDSIDRLAHLTWLRIDGHYAIERILEFDQPNPIPRVR